MFSSAPFFGIVIDALLFDGCGAWCIVTIGRFWTHKAVLFIWAYPWISFFPAQRRSCKKTCKNRAFSKTRRAMQRGEAAGRSKGLRTEKENSAVSIRVSCCDLYIFCYLIVVPRKNDQKFSFVSGVSGN